MMIFRAKTWFIKVTCLGLTSLSILGVSSCGEPEKNEKSTPVTVNNSDDQHKNDIASIPEPLMQCDESEATIQLSNLLREEIRKQSEAFIINQALDLESDVNTSELHKTIDNLLIDLLQPKTIGNYYNFDKSVNQCIVNLTLRLPDDIVSKATDNYEKISSSESNSISLNDYLDQQNISINHNTISKDGYKYDIYSDHTETTIKVVKNSEILTFLSRFIAMSQSDKIINPLEVNKEPKVMLTSTVKKQISTAASTINNGKAESRTNNKTHITTVKSNKVETNNVKNNKVETNTGNSISQSDSNGSAIGNHNISNDNNHDVSLQNGLSKENSTEIVSTSENGNQENNQLTDVERTDDQLINDQIINSEKNEAKITDSSSGDGNSDTDNNREVATSTIKNDSDNNQTTTESDNEDD